MSDDKNTNKEDGIKPISLAAEDMEMSDTNLNTTISDASSESPGSQSSRPSLSTEELQKMLEYIVKNIVSEKDKVIVEVLNDSVGSCTVTVEVAEADKGRVIGKGGRTIRAIRDLASIFGRIWVTIKE